LQFEVNGQIYFLNFAPQEGRWFLYVPTGNGFRRMEIASDQARLLVNTFMPVDEKNESVVN
jgi:hypothetical protein